SAEQADWARDGARVVYRRYLPPFGIWISDPKSDTDTLLRVSGTPLDGTFPRWSPTEDVIAFSKNAIYSVAADGSSLTVLAKPKIGHRYEHPRWFPDGKSIALSDITTVTRTLVMSASGASLRALPMSIGDSEAISGSGDSVIVQSIAKDDTSQRYIVLYRR